MSIGESAYAFCPADLTPTIVKFGKVGLGEWGVRIELTVRIPVRWAVIFAGAFNIFLIRKE